MVKKLFIVVILFLLATSILYLKIDNTKEFKLNINNKDILIEVVDTEESRNKGLSDRESILKDYGMLFVFDKPDKYGFWMKDMKFPIDIVWLDKNLKIVHIENKVIPESYPRVFIPPENSLYVIEFNAGFIEENQLSVGNILDLTKK